MVWSADATFVAPYGACGAQATKLPTNMLSGWSRCAYIVVRYEAEVDVYTPNGVITCQSTPAGGGAHFEGAC